MSAPTDSPNANSIVTSVNEDKITAYNNQRLIKNASSLCFAPYVNLYFGRSGKIYCCCHNRDHFVGEYPKDSISEIWNGKRIANLRNHLKSNNLSLGCQHCQYDMDMCNYNQVAANHFDKLPPLDIYPRMMEFELDSTCNLECEMCNGELSSAIRKNRDKLPPIASKYDRNFVDQLKPFLPHLLETRFSGGEPFLIPLYFQIWDELIKVNPNCLISIQTNGTVLNKKLVSYLEKGRFEIGISLDSTKKKTFEEIRRNAKFETVMSNVRYFSQYCQSKKTTFRLSICVMRNNWENLPDYIDLCNQLDAYACFHRVTVPSNLSLFSLSSGKINEVLEYLSKFQWNPKNHLERVNANHYNEYLTLVKKWHANRKTYEDRKAEYSTKSLSDLFGLLNTQMMNYAKKTNYDLEQSVQRIREKVMEVCQHFPEEQHKEIIHLILSYDSGTIFNKFYHAEVDELVSEINNRIDL
jgi:MoaA/NifB/PqqE/SkfB family radical SAM enzyme